MQYTKEEREKYKAEYAKYKQKLKSGWEHKPYNEFLSIVTQRPEELDKDNPFCPFCGSHNLHLYNHIQTLVGGRGIDPNHHWMYFTCNSCQQKFVMEFKGIRTPNTTPLLKRIFKFNEFYNVWYTQNNKILRGIPSCFENYIYTCNKCGGDVHRHHFDRGTRNDATMLTDWLGDDADQHRSYTIHFICQKCGAEVQSFNDYYDFSNPHAPRKPLRPIKWTIQEEIGFCVVNDLTLNQIEIESEKE